MKQFNFPKIGQEALQSKLKYKYLFATTALLENQPVTGEMFDFSFKNVFGLENGLSHENKIEKPTFENPELKQKLQFQLFGNDIYKGEIIELYESSPYINYKNISLQCEITAPEDSFELSIYKSNLNKPDLQFLIDLPENEEIKSKLIRKGNMSSSLSRNIQLPFMILKCMWTYGIGKNLRKTPKIDWSDRTIFKLFLENGEGSAWSVHPKKHRLKA